MKRDIAQTDRELRKEIRKLANGLEYFVFIEDAIVEEPPAPLDGYNDDLTRALTVVSELLPWDRKEFLKIVNTPKFWSDIKSLQQQTLREADTTSDSSTEDSEKPDKYRACRGQVPKYLDCYNRTYYLQMQKEKDFKKSCKPPRAISVEHLDLEDSVITQEERESWISYSSETRDTSDSDESLTSGSSEINTSDEDQYSDDHADTEKICSKYAPGVRKYEKTY